MGSGLKTFESDVLVLGGGPAGTWAAYTAASQGVKVVLADKGYCGSSGATAASGTNLWHVRSEPARREASIRRFLSRGNGLANRRWLEILYDHTKMGTEQLIELGYPFPLDEHGRPISRNLQGPEYMRLMRKTVRKAGVVILDHSPALKLITGERGVSGAAGVNLETGEEWSVHAKAVIIATGGCAFLSRALGCNVLTGDGYLMAAEAGAVLSGMEFSNIYGFSTEFSSCTKNFLYHWATFYREDNSVITNTDKRALAIEMQRAPVYARIDKASDAIRIAMRRSQPNFFLSFDRLGKDPFRERFPITLRLEGTVRGTGGINLVDDTCATNVPGLYAAGDAATREFVAGATTGGGHINASWAICSGRISGSAAADYALGTEAAAMRTQLHFRFTERHSAGKPARSMDMPSIVKSIQEEVIPYDKNLFRTETSMRASLARLNDLWKTIRLNEHDPNDVRALVRSREAASMIATARWMYTSALERKESRGMHQHDDYPAQDNGALYRVLISGVDSIRTQREPQSGGPDRS